MTSMECVSRHHTETARNPRRRPSLPMPGARRRRSRRRGSGSGARPGASGLAARRSFWIWRVQPGLALASRSALTERTLSTLRVADLLGALGLDEVVDAGAAAALVAVGDLDELDAGDRREEPARLLADPLRVGEVAGVVVGDARARSGGAARRGGSAARNSVTSRTFAENAAARVGPLRVVREEPAVVLQVRAAAGGVDDDRVHRLFLEARDRVAGEGERLLARARRGSRARRSTPVRAGRGPRTLRPRGREASPR